MGESGLPASYRSLTGGLPGPNRLYLFWHKIKMVFLKIRRQFLQVVSFWFSLKTMQGALF